ncbi:unnamed protein product [Ixodes hexagonus]
MFTLGRSLRIATLNVRGLAARWRQRQLYRLLTEKELDILAIQETKVESEEQTNNMVEPFLARYLVCVCHAIGFSAGCCLFLKKSLGIEVQTVMTCQSGRFILCDLTLLGREWRVLCIYAPNKTDEHRMFFENIYQHFLSDRFIIFLGDFNCVWRMEDRSNRTRNSDNSIYGLNNIIQDFDLEDIAFCTPRERATAYTNFQGNSHAID